MWLAAKSNRALTESCLTSYWLSFKGHARMEICSATENEVVVPGCPIFLRQGLDTAPPPPSRQAHSETMVHVFPSDP